MSQSLTVDLPSVTRAGHRPKRHGSMDRSRQRFGWFVGFDNYLQAFRDPQFLQGVGFVVKFSLVLIPLQMLVSLTVALVLDALTDRLAKFARLMIFVPYAVPVVIGAMMWGFLYSPRFGPMSEIF